jgi:hypothetical protein
MVKTAGTVFEATRNVQWRTRRLRAATIREPACYCMVTASEAVMRNARKPHPEWGYLAPAPSVFPAVRTALIASAIGAIGGAAVVISLIERPVSNEGHASIAAHAVFSSGPTITPSPALPKLEAHTQDQAAATAGAGLQPTAVAGTTGGVPNPQNPNEPISPIRSAPRSAASAAIPPTAAAAIAKVDAVPTVAPASVAESPTGKQRLTRNEARKRWHRFRHRRLFDDYGGRAWRYGGAMHDEW